jgi:UDP-N-acetylglucosamine diphosphorylase / glucose-1-phosphate thymidylyltransferase / UDP-N-acetylgalactosamine diphosphorylase / glucosamine-1-phosphate N-acetyltransferase / galactosamine-1-phosphate N-acetyltransferase
VTEPRLFLFDDQHARRWAPFTLTRPAGELLFGCMSLRERAEQVFRLPCSGHLSRTALVGFDEPGASPGVSLSEVGTEGVRILLLSRAALDFQAIELPSGSARIVVDGEVVGWVLPDGTDLPDEAALRDPAAWASEGALTVDLRGQLLRRPWDLIAHNDARLTDDFVHFWSDDSSPDGVIRIGDHELSLGEGASIEAGVHLDLRDGPIRLEEGARVEGPARLTGPLFVGKHSTILGGTVGTSSIGPSCLVRGEVAHSVLLGFVNKAHDGHIGHAIVGRWVNLGAFTTNSDLKNNYRPVRVWTPDGEEDSGLLKVGCFLGDHVKTGIGTTLNTGSVIGAGSNVYGGAMPPSVVPPFSWGAGSDFRDHRLEKFLDTAARAMARRDQRLTGGVIAILRTAWEATAGRRAE